MGRDPRQLHPDLQPILAEFQKRCKAAGLNVLITETFRTVAEQNALYAKGRTKPGKIVTRCKGTEYESPHQWGCAFDFCENVKGKEYANESFFRKCGKIGKDLGLFWGGDFRTFYDSPHLEYPRFIVNNSTDSLKKKYGTPEKFIATWGKPSQSGGSKPASTTVNPAAGTSKKKLITALQQALNDTGATLAVDGIWGVKTQTAAGKKLLKEGSLGPLVTILQQALTLSGYPLTADGKFGDKTLSAVKQLQAKHKLVVDGLVGELTWHTLLG